MLVPTGYTCLYCPYLFVNFLAGVLVDADSGLFFLEVVAFRALLGNEQRVQVLQLNVARETPVCACVRVCACARAACIIINYVRLRAHAVFTYVIAYTGPKVISLFSRKAKSDNNSAEAWEGGDDGRILL